MLTMTLTLISCNQRQALPDNFYIEVNGERRVGIWSDDDITYYNDEIICYQDNQTFGDEHKCFIGKIEIIEALQ